MTDYCKCGKYSHCQSTGGSSSCPNELEQQQANSVYWYFKAMEKEHRIKELEDELARERKQHEMTALWAADKSINVMKWKIKGMKERIENMIALLRSGGYDNEAIHGDYDQILEDFILGGYDDELRPQMRVLIFMKKDFWYA